MDEWVVVFYKAKIITAHLRSPHDDKIYLSSPKINNSLAHSQLNIEWIPISMTD